MELLWRCGYIDLLLEDCMLPNDKYCHEIAKNILQFKYELPEIKLTMMKLSAEVAFTPAVHCELVDRGIEYLWRDSKILFRRENIYLENDKRVNSLKSRIKRIITNTPVETY